MRHTKSRDIARKEQENFWSSSFGDEYQERNKLVDLLPAKTSLFSEIIQNTLAIKSFIEFGSNTGVNLIAIKNLIPSANVSAVEINKKAIDVLKKLKICKSIWHDSILKFDKQNIADLSFTSGVLIHLNPDYLNLAYEALYNSSKKHILVQLRGPWAKYTTHVLKPCAEIPFRTGFRSPRVSAQL